MSSANRANSSGSGGGPLLRESGLMQRLRRSFDELGDGRPSRVLVGYSGGVDSLGLLSLLANLSRHQGFNVRAVHVDHGVRQTSARDADVASASASALGVELDIRAIPEGTLAAHVGVGREEALRRERYRILAMVASEWRADVVALAHHQRDQAESVVLHLLRGAGIRGASGMRPLTELRVPWWDVSDADDAPTILKIWRPLLGASAGELQEHAGELGLPIAVDESNSDESYRRNAIRHAVLPVLERVAPGATINLARFAELAGEDSLFLDGLARQHLDDVGNAAGIERAWLMELPLAIQRRVLQFWIARHAPASLEISRNRLEEVVKVAKSKGPDRIVELGLGYVVEITRERLVVRRSDES